MRRENTARHELSLDTTTPTRRRTAPRSGFQRTLDHIRSIADTPAEQGNLFERLMKTYLEQDPIYRERFTNVWLWSEWATRQPGARGNDTGIDLVGEEANGNGLCAIQCKCYAPGTRLAKADLDSFIAASNRDPFVSRLFIDTGDEWGRNAIDTLEGLKPACHVLRFGDLARRPVDWPNLATGKPEGLAFRHGPLRLRPHQREAYEAVCRGLATAPRGKLVMACGTGKTFVALRVAETLAGITGRVLFLVPSISLLQQSIREWAEQQAIPHGYVGICSDTRAAGHAEEDASPIELEIPVTTEPGRIAGALAKTRPDAMTVVFCTYHSLDLVRQAQDNGAPAFDLVVCDEAHRTTGVDHPDDRTSPFVLVHDENRIRADRRLYMTATPRIYTGGAKSKARSHSAEVFSMDETATYGEELYVLPFSQAVEHGLLADYKVAINVVSEEHVDDAYLAHVRRDGGKSLTLPDAAKIVGAWRVLQNPEARRPEDGPIRPVRRAIAFSNSIRASKRLTTHWGRIIEEAASRLPEPMRTAVTPSVVHHVDGKSHALKRKDELQWLREPNDTDRPDECRILSNARCLSEGIDVPALDAVVFLEPRNSQVEVVQAVGRAMRKADDKTHSLIVLTVAIPAGVDPKKALDDNRRFANVWAVLKALRSHDDRFDAEINKIDLNEHTPDRIRIFGPGDGTTLGDDDNRDPRLHLPFPPLDIPPDALYAKIVDKCGDRRYWESWAKDVADLCTRLVARIAGLLDDPKNEGLREWFDDFHRELRTSINDAIGREDVVYMMAQHILTQPVFEALFEQYDFAGENPVSKAMDSLRRDFGEFGLENETRDLERFYESVRMRARDIDNSAGRQKVLMELYEKFFATAMEKDAERLGIVYTPIQVVDFILRSADAALAAELGRRLTDEDVHILDPFAGTGIFHVRLMMLDKLIKACDLPRKYRHEMHANELILLAYYIAAIHIEEAYHGRTGGAYEPFGGIVLTDTFNLHTKQQGFPMDWLPDNSERAERQQKLPIQVIVGNPPWSAGQRSAAHDNPNVDYPELEQRITETYAAHSTATLKKSLYDSYKKAIRWASDRLGEKGVIAFVTNGAWLDGSADAGLRACLASEFTSAWVLNLRGNQRTQGETSRREGGKVFGQGSRTPVAITILVRNPNAKHTGCRIRYRDIGDYLTREQKLAILEDTQSINGITDWIDITPDRHHDWIGQRDDAFQAFLPMGSKETKAGKADNSIFKLFSLGYLAGRDAYLYNYSHTACAKNALAAIEDYTAAMRSFHHNPSQSIDAATTHHSSNIRWDRNLKDNLSRKKAISFTSEKVWRTQYRPFTKQYCYAEYKLAARKYQMDSIFPQSDSANRAICTSGIGATKTFSALMVDTMPNLHIVEFGQCFPRYHFEKPTADQQTLLDSAPPQSGRIDNITDATLKHFRAHYDAPRITKDAIFDYVYGVLHAPEYRERYANDLRKSLPHIPLTADFHAFAEAGTELSALHIGYETCREYPLEVVTPNDAALQPEHCRLTTKKMRFTDETKTTLRVNDQLSLTGIPPQAHQYEINGRTPLGWLIDRYHIRQDKQSGIVNDPNEWFDDPLDLVATIRRIVHVSTETARIVAGLPSPFSNTTLCATSGTSDDTPTRSGGERT